MSTKLYRVGRNEGGLQYKDEQEIFLQFHVIGRETVCGQLRFPVILSVSSWLLAESGLLKGPTASGLEG